MTETVAANPVSATAYWTLAARHADATGPRPIANDTYAERFMDDTARTVAARFARLKRPTASFPVRHRVIDDLLRAELVRDPELRVVVLGCGFDTRAFRLGGGRWLEIDEPELLASKEARLPVSESRQQLERLAIRFGGESLETALAGHASDDRVVVVLEGVLGYLTDDARRALLISLGRLLPRHVVLCDLHLDGPMDGHAPIMPASLKHYDLHVWLWRANPAGVYSPTNAAVQCPKGQLTQTEGHVH